MIGSLATLGYADKKLARELPGIMRVNPSAYVVDTRFSPSCSWSPTWQRANLKIDWGDRYLYRGDWLGNIHYRDPDKPIQLVDAAQGIPWLIRGLERGFTLLLLCGCADYERCHRKVIYDLVQAQLGDVLPSFVGGEHVETPLGQGIINPDIPLEVHRARNRYGVLFHDSPQHYFYPSELQPCQKDNLVTTLATA